MLLLSAFASLRYLMLIGLMLMFCFSIHGDASSSCDGVLDAAASVLDHSMFH